MGLAFPFPFIDVLTLPTDASSGQRIVLDGVNGAILLYNSADELVGEWVPERFCVSEGSGGSFVCLVPNFVPSWGGTVAALLFDGDIAIVHDDVVSGVAITSMSHLGDLLIEGPSGIFQSVPRGIIKRESLDTNNVHTVDGVSDLNVSNVEVVAGRTYAVHLHTQYDLSAAGTWHLELRVNGATVDRFATINESAAKVDTIDSTLYWVPSATASTDDLDLFMNEVAGAATLTLQGAAGVNRTFTVSDVGVG